MQQSTETPTNICIRTNSPIESLGRPYSALFVSEEGWVIRETQRALVSAHECHYAARFPALIK